jgi:PAS domain S-box-containing protein
MTDRDDLPREAKDGGRRAQEGPGLQKTSPKNPSPAEEVFPPAQEKYRLLAESAPLGIALIGSNDCYQYLNPKFVDLFGYTLDDIPSGREWLAKAFPDPAYRGQVIAAWKLYMQESRGGEAEPRTFTVTCKDGSTKLIKFRAVPLEGGEQFILYKDVTDLQEAEAARQETEELFRVLYECAADAFFLHDHGKILAVNQQTCNSLGYSREELVGMTIADIEVGVSPEELAALWQQPSVPPGTIFGVHRRKDGTTFPVEVRASNFDHRGRNLRLALVRDITERRHAEAALRESELKYRTLVEQIPAITYTAAVDDFSTTTYISPQVEAILGFSPADYEADPNIWVQRLHPEDRDRVLAAVARCHETGEPFVSEYRTLAKDGRIVWLRDEARLVHDASGRPLFLQGVTLDLTQRRELEGALQESEAHYRFIAENVRDVIWTTDLDLRFTYVSPSVQQLLGFAPEEILGKTMGEFLPPASLARALEVLSEELDREESGLSDPKRYRVVELEEVHKNGSVLWTEVKAGFIRDADQQPRGILGVTRDITKRKEAEAALRKSEEQLRFLSYQLLTAQEQERRRLAAKLHNVLGHDLLLLKLKLEALQEKLAPDPGPRKKEVGQILGALQNSVRNVRRLCQDLTPGDLEDLGLTTALHLLVENFAMAQKLAWQTELDDLDNLFGMPVQTALYRLVQEALTNIGKHARAQHLWLQARRAETEVVFVIEDDGRGFNVAQALAAHKTLGLLAMEERVQILGGAFDIVSRKKAGTKISFTIPISGAKPHRDPL